MKGRNRCRYHGGAKGSGAPSGEANGAWKHGGFTGEAVELRRSVSRLLKVVRDGTEAEAPPADLLEAMAAMLGLKLTRAEKRERNKAAWGQGDRRKWGGEKRSRDPRRGWRNHRRRGQC